MPESQREILIIDDNENIGIMLSAMLTMHNYVVKVRTSTDNLEELLSEIKPNVLIMDMLISGSDGSVTCKNLKSNPEFSSIPIIMFSAHPMARIQCMKAGANFFLEKPFEMTDLLQKIEEAIVVIN